MLDSELVFKVSPGDIFLLKKLLHCNDQYFQAGSVLIANKVVGHVYNRLHSTNEEIRHIEFIVNDNTSVWLQFDQITFENMERCK